MSQRYMLARALRSAYSRGAIWRVTGWRPTQLGPALTAQTNQGGDAESSGGKLGKVTIFVRGTEWRKEGLAQQASSVNIYLHPMQRRVRVL